MSYDARKKELLEALAKTDHDAASKEAMSRVLDNYFNQREARLENLLELLEPSEESCHGKWIDKAKEYAAFAHEALGRQEQGKLWFAAVSNEEHTFFFKLMISQIPVQRDLMVKQTLALAKAEREFEEKWNVIREADKGIDERLQKIAQEYGELLTVAANHAANFEKEARETLANLLRTAVSGALKLVSWGVLEYVIKGAVSKITGSYDQTQARKYEIQALLSREESVFATFKEARQMVAEFLQTTSYPHVKNAYDAAEKAADALAGEMLTNGQKDDAKNFGAASEDELKKVFAKAEDAYKAFAKKHEYLFFGPLGSTYYQELMEDDSWKAHSSRWKDSKKDIDDLLRERIFEINDDKILEVSLQGLTSEDKDIIYYTLEAHLKELMRTWNKFKEINNEPEWALESRETLKSILDAMR